MIILCFGLAPSAFAADKTVGVNKKILVNIERQILIAVEANKRVFEYDVVTGRPNKETNSPSQENTKITPARHMAQRCHIPCFSPRTAKRFMVRNGQQFDLTCMHT
jgi:hypothetical protein